MVKKWPIQFLTQNKDKRQKALPLYKELNLYIFTFFPSEIIKNIIGLGLEHYLVLYLPSLKQIADIVTFPDVR